MLALTGIAITIVVALVPAFRQRILRSWRSAALRAGFPRRAYARWFVRTWGVYDNPYLDDVEKLDLTNTYVPLSFHASEADAEALTIASAVLADKHTGNVIIDGAPGSGKSTLLKAFAVTQLESGRALTRNRPIVPVLIQLRKLSQETGDPIEISKYIVNQILVSACGMKPNNALTFFKYALANEEVVVLLDGLDEVGTDRWQAVQQAIYAFATNHSPDCPSHRARLIVTCREQNLAGIRSEWVPAIVQEVYSLKPLRDSEIRSYLNKLRQKFKIHGGPEIFFEAVKASGSLDLHRVPLILAMSVGMYAPKDHFEIPSSIANLYQAIIQEMLDRHRFKHEPGSNILKFKMVDKYRLLREFALLSATSESGFGEFERAELVRFAASLAHDLDNVRDPEAFVDEIVRHSGLLSDVGEAKRYVFAHRSIQEYLAAQQSRSASGGAGILLDKANDREWRQVIQFYCAGLEQVDANLFLEALSGYNSELAGYCLASAKVSDSTAAVILDRLYPLEGVRLSAMAAATMSPRVSIRDMAVGRLQDELSSGGSQVLSISAEVDAVVPLLDSLVGTNDPDVVALVPQLVENLTDDPRLAEPLWKCLAVPGVQSRSESRQIVERLLTIATGLDGFANLAALEPHRWAFLAQYRDSSYPFKHGLDADHNLVALLSWAEYLDVVPINLNRFFEAKYAGCLARIEADRRGTVSFSLFWVARIFSVSLCLSALVAAPAALAIGNARLFQPLGWLTVGLVVGVAAVPFVGFLMLNLFGDILSDQSPLKRVLAVDEKPEDLPHMLELARSWVRGRLITSVVMAVGIVVVPLAIGLACLPLLDRSMLLYLAVALSGGAAYWLPGLGAFARTRRYYLRRTNVYVDIYDDPRSEHWISKPRPQPEGWHFR